ncbi:MAG: type II restriction endonuclease [Alphaproteobacteria bacterium HGW-Alphaproteobacteria-12]|nr:MAG: type II restriction endonuclease [Alphaproteobacteria bacterium HGW-Alphaproteobacteria-12]
MAVADLVDWLDEYTGEQFVWYVKRLSGNDTLANKSHQAGPYVPKPVLFELFPDLNQPERTDPDCWFDLYVDSHSDFRTVRAVWYNNKYRGGTRDEARLTNFGGKKSALLDPENTGALAVFVFILDPEKKVTECHVWVCDLDIDAEIVEDRIGPVEPGQWKLWSPLHPFEDDLFVAAKQPTSCWLTEDKIPVSWFEKFPTGAEIIQKAIALRADAVLPPDKRLMRRRECEFEIFRSIEAAREIPAIKAGFKTIDDFIAKAQTILQRRKSRSGRSLELQTKAIFLEERLVEGTDFSHQPESEGRKKPDFLFPSAFAYANAAYPANQLRMLAVKTTCRDRWRQILNEADRIKEKHLLTLQEGVSESQFSEMTDAGVRLVVPAPLVTSYPAAVRPHLQSLESFIGDIRLLR